MDQFDDGRNGSGELVIDREEHGSKAVAPMETASAIIAAIGHDLRTPMNGVLGMAELILTDDNLDERHRRRVEIIQRSGKTLLSLLDQILDLAKIDAEDDPSQAVPFDLREILDQLTFNESGTELQVDVVDRLDAQHRFLGDAARIRKLLSCFVNSAAKFATDRPLHIVATAETGAVEEARIQFRTDNASIDAEAMHERLVLISGDRSSTTSHFDEAGLGLALCRNLAMTMDGTIGVDRTSCDAPAFWLSVYLSPDPAALDANSISEVRPVVRRGKSADQAKSAATRSILVAEDDQDMALLIEDFLDDAGYQATIAHDGASTLKILGEQRFDALLLDGHMPDMTGFEAARLIRQLMDDNATIPIIALTGEAMTGDRERYLSAGMDDYIAKPVDYKTLIDTIERCCG